MVKNTKLMEMASDSLDGKWGLAIGTMVVYMVISISIQTIPMGSVAWLIVGGPFSLGVAIFSLSISRNQEGKLEQIFYGFNNFTTTLGAYLLMILYIFLWALLLVIPGIMAALSYSMIFYIIADEPGIGAKAALDKSKNMMYGYKWKLFGLWLMFLGLALICVLTLGIGFLWFIPFVNVTMAKFYDDVKLEIAAGNI
ncbi:MAG: DUF975 family protein [bacterium]